MERAEYIHDDLALDEGDLLLTYTDGLTESRNRDDRMLGTAGLLDAVRLLDAERPDTLLSMLLTQLSERGYSFAADDLTVLLVRADGTNSSWRNNLLAPVRLLRRARDSSRIAPPPSSGGTTG